MTQDSVITIMQTALKTIIFTAAPPLLCSLVVGIAVSIFQTITSISEQTLSFVPKVLAVFLSIIIFGAYMMTNLEELFVSLCSDFSKYIQ